MYCNKLVRIGKDVSSSSSSYFIKLIKKQHLTKTTMADGIEKGKKVAAYKAVDENIDHTTKLIGIGSGSTILYGIERLAERVKNEGLHVSCVPSSFQAKQAIIQYGLNLTDLEMHSSIDIAIDGADEVDKDLNCIKGGGGCHFQEKLVIFMAKKFVIVADERKRSEQLGKNWTSGIPIEVLPMAHRLVKETIEKKLLGQAILRQAKFKAGPVVTDNGNFILDWKFESSQLLFDNNNNNIDWKQINIELKSIPGVIETGLFINMASKAYFGNADGSVTCLHK